jgi:outer membrane receptor for ferrienterochelin and colicin
LSDRSTLSLGASRRVTHPDAGQLNPFVHREYAPNLEAGNPALSPQLTSSVEARYGFDADGLAAGLTGYYRANHGSVSQVTETLGDGETLTTQTNLARDQDTGVEFNLSGRLATKFGYSLSGDAYRRQISGTVFSFSALRVTEGVNGKLKLDYRPTRDGTAQVTLIRTDRVLTPQGYIAATNLVNAGYEHRLTDRLTAVATMSDLFNGQRFRSWVITPLFSEDYRINTRGRIAYLGFVYSFDASTGKPPELQYEK